MYPRRDKESGLYGYWKRGGWAIEPQFQYANHLMSGYGGVRYGDGRYGLIEADGTVHFVDEICGGRTPVAEEYWTPSFSNWNGEPGRYAAIRVEDRGRRRWGLIDTDLNYIPLPAKVPAKARRVAPCGEYLVVVCPTRRRHESACGLFHLGEMRMQIPIEYSCIYPPKGASKGTLWVVRRPERGTNDRRNDAFYDMDRREIVSDWYFGTLPVACGFGAICERQQGGRGWYFVDENLQPAFAQEFDGVDRFSCGLAGVYKGEEAGFIDTEGRMRLLLPHYDDMKPFNEHGLAIANRDSSEWDLDIIDRTGRARLSGFDTAVFWDGDFPNFEVSKDGEDRVYGTDLNRLY